VINEKYGSTTTRAARVVTGGAVRFGVAGAREADGAVAPRGWHGDDGAATALAASSPSNGRHRPGLLLWQWRAATRRNGGQVSRTSQAWPPHSKPGRSRTTAIVQTRPHGARAARPVYPAWKTPSGWSVALIAADPVSIAVSDGPPSPTTWWQSVGTRSEAPHP